jgi:hypothetical protein
MRKMRIGLRIPQTPHHGNLRAVNILSLEMLPLTPEGVGGFAIRSHSPRG